MYTYRILFLLMIVPSALIATMIAVTSKETRAMREDKAVTQWVADLPRPENQTLDGILFTPDGAFLVAIGFDRDKKQGVVHFWEIERRKLVRTLVEPDAVAAAAFTPDGKRLVTACWDNKMRIYSCDNWKLEHSFDYDPPGQTANHLAMLSDGKRFVSGNVGYQGPRIWDLEKRSAVSLAAPRQNRL
jgi:WD40 repeat protein